MIIVTGLGIIVLVVNKKFKGELDMTFNTFTSGVNTSFSSQLNQNFLFGVGEKVPMIIYEQADASSDWSSTKTNLTYDAVTDEFYAAGSVSVTLNPATQYSTRNFYINHSFDDGIVKFDYNIYSVIDECDNSSVDAMWSASGTGTGTESLSENTTRLRMTADTNGGSPVRTSYLTNSTNFYNTGYSAYVYWAFDPTDTSSATPTVVIYDGSTSVTLTGVGVGHVYLKFNGTSSVDVWEDGAYVNNFDLSGLSTTWNIRWVVVTANTNSTITYTDIYFLRRENTSPTTTVTQSISFDGTNYVSASSSMVTTSSYSGNRMVPRLTATVASGEVISIKGVRSYVW